MSPAELRSKYDSLYLHLKLFDYVTTIPLWNNAPQPFSCGCSSRRNSGLSVTELGSLSTRFPTTAAATFSAKRPVCQENECLVNRLRVHYFFTHDELIDPLVKDTKIGIRLTTGAAWSTNVVASANSFALRGLNERLTSSAQKAECIVSLFHESTPQLFGHLRVLQA